MKVPLRIVVPILLALACTGAIVVFLWWQIMQSTNILVGPLAIPGVTTSGTETEERLPLPPIDPRDEALVALRQGDLLALRGQWKEAQELYEKAVKEDGGLPAFRKLAQAQLQRRDTIGVRATIRKMRDAGARAEDLLLLESVLELRSGELLKAQELLTNAQESPQKHYGLALLATIQGDHTIAQQELAQVMNGWEPVLRSYAHTLQAAYDEFALFPEGSNLHLITLLSRALAQVQECELALPLLVQVTSTEPNYRDAWIVQGYCELVTERAQESLESLEQAYNLDPQKPEIQYFLGRAYAALAQHRNAITFLEYALVNGFEPGSEVRMLIAQEALEEGDTLLALEQYEALTREERATVETFEGFITASTIIGNTEEAYVKAKEASQRWPEDARAFLLLGKTSIQTDRNTEARTALEKALILNPALMEARELLQGMQEI
ncbi:hypothetical protein COU80_02445 [Candidatus Peregrinibacteria bacterium CG10_big_fil_rev_8_21_14_0_10_55_24]|nr:MAG: hypothetical protein COU80_02445 [Candidatus Peregrinibacteria bacterium CG10_big_fil_rev_8_21_14_0_10_55_24]